MKRRKQAAAPKIETDLSRIQQLSQAHDDENWAFRSWLKQHAPDDIDDLVKSLSQKYFALIDCTQCANGCRSLHLEFKESELHTIAKTLGQSIEAFEKQLMSDGQVNPPCPMLNGKLCSIYEHRPDVCRSYPHLEQPEFTSRLFGVLDPRELPLHRSTMCIEPERRTAARNVPQQPPCYWFWTVPAFTFSASERTFGQLYTGYLGRFIGSTGCSFRSVSATETPFSRIGS
jgi:Fe-S-cluster containining protein